MPRDCGHQLQLSCSRGVEPICHLRWYKADVEARPTHLDITGLALPIFHVVNDRMCA